MNTNLVSNVTVLTLAMGAIGKGIEFLTEANYVNGGVLVFTGIVLLILYEKLPFSTPPTDKS